MSISLPSLLVHLPFSSCREAWVGIVASSTKMATFSTPATKSPLALLEYPSVAKAATNESTVSSLGVSGGQ